MKTKASLQVAYTSHYYAVFDKKTYVANDRASVSMTLNDRIGNFRFLKPL